MSDELEEICLTELKRGETGIVKRILGGRTFRQRLFDLGLLPGHEVTVRQRPYAYGPRLLFFRNSEFFMGYGQVQKIYVEKVTKKTVCKKSF